MRRKGRKKITRSPIEKVIVILPEEEGTIATYEDSTIQRITKKWYYFIHWKEWNFIITHYIYLQLQWWFNNYAFNILNPSSFVVTADNKYICVIGCYCTENKDEYFNVIDIIVIMNQIETINLKISMTNPIFILTISI